MAVALADHRGIVNTGHPAVRRQVTFIGAKAHGATEVVFGVAPFQLVAAHPFGEQPDHRFFGGAEFRRPGATDAGEIARHLDHRHLHAETYAEIGHLALAGELDRRDLALGAAFPEPTGHQDAVDVVQFLHGALGLEDLRFDPVEIDAHVVADAAMDQRFGQRFIGILKMGVLADDADLDLAFRRADAFHDFDPAGEVRLAPLVQPEMAADQFVEAMLMVADRDLVDGIDVQGLDHRLFANVAELGDLAPLGIGDFPVGAAQESVGLDTDG